MILDKGESSSSCVSHLLSLSRLGGGYQAVRRGAGLVPQNLRGGNHKSQCAPPKPQRKYPCQMCHAETGGRGLTKFSTTFHVSKVHFSH